MEDKSQYKFLSWPKPVGGWILYDGATPHTMFSMYKKPFRIQIWFTEKLLGWKWKDAE